MRSSQMQLGGDLKEICPIAARTIQAAIALNNVRLTLDLIANDDRNEMSARTGKTDTGPSEVASELSSHIFHLFEMAACGLMQEDCEWDVDPVAQGEQGNRRKPIVTARARARKAAASANRIAALAK